MGWQNSFSHATSNSKGVCLLFKCKTQMLIEKITTDISGRYVIVDVQIKGIIYTVANIYVPNDDQLDFLLISSLKYKSLY